MFLFSSTGNATSDFCDAYTFGNGTAGNLTDGSGGGADCDPNVLTAAGTYSTTFVTLAKLAGLDEIFACPGPFTALVPTDAAFSKLDPALLSYLSDPANVDVLKDVLLYHILPDLYLGPDFVPGPIETVQGEAVTVSTIPLKFNNGTVINPDVVACNGAIDTIDEVLLPPSFPGLGKYLTLVIHRLGHGQLR